MASWALISVAQITACWPLVPSAPLCLLSRLLGGSPSELCLSSGFFGLLSWWPSLALLLACPLLVLSPSLPPSLQPFSPELYVILVFFCYRGWLVAYCRQWASCWSSPRLCYMHIFFFLDSVSTFRQIFSVLLCAAVGAAAPNVRR